MKYFPSDPPVKFKIRICMSGGKWKQLEQILSFITGKLAMVTLLDKTVLTLSKMYQ